MLKELQQIFSDPTAQWFSETLGEPTKVQREAWPAIASGQHVLVSAPTGTGKTLSAFLVFIDQMMEQARVGKLEEQLLLIYISPLKSLAGDIRENLYRPLNGISAHELPPIKVALRTGDTTTSERAKMAKKPPHILITTPESLYLLLTSKSGQQMLRTAKSIIIDELHAMLDTKRGAHMMLSLARLDALCGCPLQRVGLSATIQPLELSADYLSNGIASVQIIAPVMNKSFEIKIINPFPGGKLPEGTIWPEIAKKVIESCADARSVIAFTEGRLMAEQLAFYVNKLKGEGFARTHHGSVSKEQRFEVENDLRSGNLRLLCATSSMELGIDVGEIDRVLQVACPLSISGVMQRLGRAGHNPGRLSIMEMYPRMVSENLYCALTAQTAREGNIEPSKPPRFCFDVLAQHLVSMSVSTAFGGSGYTLDDVMELLPHAYPFREVTKNNVCSVLEMLAGDFEHAQEIPVRPRLNYDRINERVEGDAYSRMLAVSAGGTIPDTGKFTAKTESGVKIGELDEEFVFEQRVGLKFLLGSFAWKITGINKDTVTVAQTTSEGAKPPFWRVQIGQGRKIETGLAFGKHMRKIAEAAYNDSLILHFESLGLDENAAIDTADFITRQIEITKVLPSDKAIIAEHFMDEVGLHQIMFHSIFGRQVNTPLAILLSAVAKNLTGMDVDCYDDDDGVLLMARGEQALPEGLLQAINPETCKELLEAALPGTPIFNIAFRHNAGRALMMGVRQNKRNPLWIQRMRASEMLDSAISHPEHPLMCETKRECLEDYWDLPSLKYVLKDIQANTIEVRELFSEEPSPLCLPLRRAAEAVMMYAYYPSTNNVIAAADSATQNVLAEKLKPTATQLERVSQRGKLPEDEQALHTLLMIEGDLIAGELPIPLEWLENLAEKNRCLYIEPGLWIAAEHKDVYHAALNESDIEARQNIVRRALRYRGAMDVQLLSERYFWPEDVTRLVLDSLCDQDKSAVILDSSLYYHAELYERARRATITERRQAQTVPSANYASLIASRIRTLAPPQEQLKQAMQKLSACPYAVTLWEQSLLPARVNNYRPELLNNLLSTGEYFWVINNKCLTFHPYSDIDWDLDLTEHFDSQYLDSDELAILQFLHKRGASFLNTVAPTTEQPLQAVLFSLMEKSIIYADSFTPVRIWLERDKSEKLSPRRKAAGAVAMTSSGRWDIVRPLKAQSMEVRISNAFDKTPILSRETAHLIGATWSAALETLRSWEYTGRARRGYFVEGLSGAQYIREDAYASVIQGLKSPDNKINWLASTDPNQVWGKSLPYDADQKFTSVSGTVVALKQGIPIAVFERKGQILRVFCDSAYKSDTLTDVLIAFVETFQKKNIFASQTRVTVKQYPTEAIQALSDAGFTKVMFDYELYR